MAPDAVLDEVVRVTRRRVVVTESVYRTRHERFWLDALGGRVHHALLFALEPLCRL